MARTNVCDVFFIISPVARVARHLAFEPAIDCDVIPIILSDCLKCREQITQHPGCLLQNSHATSSSLAAFLSQPQPLPLPTLAIDDPGTRARFLTDGGGTALLASIPGSVASPQSRQRHPTTASAQKGSFIDVMTIRP